MTLWDLPPGKTAKILPYSGQLDDALAARLQDLGFAQDVVVECVRHVPFSGPRVYVVTGSVFALEKPVAQSILVALEHRP